jgi:hypothetical protein
MPLPMSIAPLRKVGNIEFPTISIAIAGNNGGVIKACWLDYALRPMCDRTFFGNLDGDAGQPAGQVLRGD